mmetsp:Transcript_36862/g.118847  ORF Transcript_36862/g.118847 Transcript_36862/m.118847 type:complete len:362 (+) Transcript_36862:544-1629(+)
MPQDLHQDAQGVVRGRDTAGLHLIQHFQRLVHTVLLRATVQNGVVHDLVRLELTILLHLRQDMEGTVDIALDTISLDNRGVRDDVRLDTGRGHVLEELRCTAHGAALGASIQHGVVGDGVTRDALAAHLLVDSEDLVDALGDREALQHGGIDHGVDAAAPLLVLHLLAYQLPGLIGLVVDDQGFGQATQGDGGGLHAPLLHLRPELLDALHVASLAVGLDHGAVGRRREVHEAALLAVALHEVGEEIHLLDADARFDDGGEEHLVDGLLDVLDEADDAAEIFGLRVVREGLQDDGARDRVRVDARGLHLLDEAPHPAAVLRHDLRVQQLVVRDFVGEQAASRHLLHEGAGLLGLATGEVGL